MKVKKEESFRISRLFRRIIDFSLLPDYLNFTNIKESVKTKLLKHGKDHRKNIKDETVDFYMIEIIRKNFVHELNLSSLFREVNKGKLKLVSADDTELALFNPGILRYLYHILGGMKIIIIEKSSILHGKPVYLVSERGIFTNKIYYLQEDEIFLSKKVLYVLAKTVEVNYTNPVELLAQIEERRKIIDDCNKSLTAIEEILELPGPREKSILRISDELKEMKAIADKFIDEKLRKRVEEIENRLCSSKQTVS